MHIFTPSLIILSELIINDFSLVYPSKNGLYYNIKNDLNKLNEADVDGLIFDLRNNGGGALDDVVKMGGFFIEDGPIVQVNGRNNRKRILSDDGIFLNYSLNREKDFESFFRMLGKNYIVEGYMGSMFLSRASVKQKLQIETVFSNPVEQRFSEILFHPELGMKTGSEVSFWGKLDANIGSSIPILGCIARQQSFQTIK